MDQAKNFAKGTIIGTVETTDTTLTVDTGQGLRFPTPPFNATLYNSTDYPDPADDPAVEIVRVTGISTDTLTVTRAQESTAARESVLGKTLFLVAGLTAKVINDLAPALDRISDASDTFRINNNESTALKLDRFNSVAALGDVDFLTEGTKVEVNDAALTVTITNQPIMPNLPTTNPAVAGALWNDGGTVKISAG